MLNFSFAFLATIIHIAGAYFRYLPFAEAIDHKGTVKLWRALLLWSIPGLLMNFLVVHTLEINMATLKLSFFFSWLPYSLITILNIPNRLPQHVFVFGIQALFAFMLHALSGVILTLLYQTVTPHLLPLHLTLWIILFLLIFPWSKQFFSGLLPNEQFITGTKYIWYIAVLPVLFYLGTIIPITNVTFLPDITDRLARLSIPLFFFLIYSLVKYSSHEEEHHHRLQMLNKHFRRQLDTLKEQTKLMQENEKAMSVLRHDLRHSYRLIYALLEKEDYESLQAHIEGQKKKLEQQ